MSDAAPATAPADAEPKKKGKLGLILGLTAVVLLGGGGAAAYMLTRGEPKDAAKKEAEPQLPAKYIALEPPFVVNFQSEDGARFLQVAVQLMTRDPAIEALVTEHDPQIRNDLLMLLGGQQATDLATREGKDKLRAQSLEAVRAILKREGGDPSKLEALYFTSFVMQ
jgi:flagellar protein FliL